MIAKALVVGAYQRKLEELSRFPDIELMLVVPPEWREPGRVLRYDPLFTCGYHTAVLPMRLNGHFHLHSYRGLGQVVRQFRPDIIHLDEEPADAVALQTVLASGSSELLFFTWQNILRRVPPPFRFIQALTLRRAHLALCGNADAVRVLRAKGYAGEVRLVPQFGFDPQLYTWRADEPAVETFVIGASGRLVPEKGFDVLLRAAARLPFRWKLEIVGEGPERGRLQALAASLGCADRLTLLGQRPSQDMPQLYHRWHVYVAPSLTRPNWKEQFNRSVGEAMCCGIPVIVSDSGEMQNVIGDVGYVVPEGHAAALEHALEIFARSSSRRRDAARRGRERVLAHYTQREIAGKTYEAYCWLLQRRESR
ncbi:MAG: glycosyltransferase [Chloroflexi bacterium]|nr:glycosyltransferase [Chloroflexota bacterium]